MLLGGVETSGVLFAVGAQAVCRLADCPVAIVCEGKDASQGARLRGLARGTHTDLRSQLRHCQPGRAGARHTGTYTCCSYARRHSCPVVLGFQANVLCVYVADVADPV